MLQIQSLKSVYNKFMPSRNVVKKDIPSTFYHVYARGHGRNAIYRDDEDYRVFFNLLKRHLNIKVENDCNGRPYVNLRGEIELTCYCLMPNHFHLLLYQIDESAMSRLMRSIMTSYSRYFNKKYELSGALFETTYKASMIISDRYLLYISRYIHLNPNKKGWRNYLYSSLQYYLGQHAPEWLQTKRITELFSTLDEYKMFIDDYDDYQSVLDEIKSELAGG